jgi:succinyl-CoA synthetase alpha subunit
VAKVSSSTPPPVDMVFIDTCQVEEEAAEIYKDYMSNLSSGELPKPVIGFIAGASTQRGLVYGHAGAVWWTDAESAESKKQCWADAGIIVSPTLGEVGMYIKREAERLGIQTGTEAAL